MNTLDQWILVTARVGALLFLAAIAAVSLVALSNRVYRMISHAVGWKLWAAALKEYRKNHPELFKTIDRMNRYRERSKWL